MALMTPSSAQDADTSPERSFAIRSANKQLIARRGSVRATT
jgi:hypothetical protein